MTALFWEKGYEATSMADILKASGLNKSSLYNSFGSKKDLFRRILDRYVETRMEGFAQMAEASGAAGKGALRAFLEAVFAFGRAGCLAVNTTTELGTSDAAVSNVARIYRTRIRAALRIVIEAATAHANPGAELTEARTEMLLGFLLGYAMSARTGADEAEMTGFTAAAYTIIEDW
ncbi:Transcriptional regulator, TetR family [Candidatus Rhodobacter oscarellae]|uniref:Transcriptional regulator, TetR family n=1 Tax=Candidatus Rhodobacter oscarellae TaxID=1675527 RepID=A0A0J9E078_9RHOB|nr:Transcriptional regulator, TetR family [Candidatus Rhodobacter lobularis]